MLKKEQIKKELFSLMRARTELKINGNDNHDTLYRTYTIKINTLMNVLCGGDIKKENKIFREFDRSKDVF